jgi:hypothetical protein
VRLVSKQIRDPAAEGLALLRKSFVALYGEKDPQTGLRLTMQSAETTGTPSQVLAGLATLHSAEAHAMLGQRRECERALADAARHFEGIAEADVALDLFSPTQHGRVSGSCYLFLDDAAQAQPILESTAREQRRHSKSRAIVLGNLSLARLRQGELDAAVASLHDAIDVIEQTWGGGGLNIVFGVCRELRPWQRRTVVRDVHDRALALMSAI